MADYSETFTKVDGNTIEASDFETQFTAIEAAIATKQDKNAALVGHAGGALLQQSVQATTSGTTIDFTGIPSWGKRITLQLDDVSEDTGAQNLTMQLGTSGGLETGAVYDYTNCTVDATPTIVAIIRFLRMI